MIKYFISFVLSFVFLQTSYAQLEAATYSIKNLKVNTEYTDMSPSLWGKGRVIFTSSKNSKSVVKKTVNSKKRKKAFLETFSGYIDKDYEIVHTKKVIMDFDTEFNQSNVTFTDDLKTVYFTQNETNRKRNENSLLKLYKASVSKVGKWSNIQKLSFCKDNYNYAHPTLSDDGKSLFFASDKPGGYGKADLYIVAILSDGSFGKVRNLGANINSKYRDNFPEVNNGLLYFSSDRIGGMGGLDIYMVPTADLFMDPTNLGAPLNSKYDDFSFIINGKTRKGFFTSNRPQGKGGDDIYSFVQEDAIKSCSQTIEGIVRDIETEAIIKNAIVNIFDEEGKWLNRFSTAGDGKFKIKLNKCEKNYRLEATKKHYNKDYSDIIYSPDKKTHAVTMRIKADDIETIAAAVNEPKYLDIPDGDLFSSIKNIDFLLNKYFLTKYSSEELDKVVKIMKENPTIIVEFSAHTDSRGPDSFNLELTKQRAAEVIRYITRKGISHNRLYGKGYGEAFPVNHCTNGVPCTDKQHLANRRTEFVILAR